MATRHKVIYFDIDGTLVDYEADSCHAFGKALEHAVRSHPKLARRLTYDVFRHARDATYVQYGDTGLPLAEWLTMCMKATLEYADVFDADLAWRMAGLYEKFRNTTLKEFDDAIEIIPALAGACKLGLISNGSSTLENLSIGKFFSYSVFAREVGHEKPAPEIFTAAIELARCSKEDVLYVGDGQHTDVIGANNAGIEMVWINRTRAALLQGIPSPEHEIRDLRDLAQIAGIE
jgi:HAD superfamily hydrolase (TIGR01549 family)